jgi:hypothetical protein
VPKINVCSTQNYVMNYFLIKIVQILTNQWVALTRTIYLKLIQVDKCLKAEKVTHMNSYILVLKVTHSS